MAMMMLVTTTTTKLVTHHNSKPGCKRGNTMSPTNQAPHGAPTTTTVDKWLPVPHHHRRVPSTVVHKQLRPTMHNDERAPLHHLCLATSGPTSSHNHDDMEQQCHRTRRQDPPPSPTQQQMRGHNEATRTGENTHHHPLQQRTQARRGEHPSPCPHPTPHPTPRAHTTTTINKW